MIKKIENSRTPTHEQISERARQIYKATGQVEGRDMDNWLQAEKQLLAEMRQNPQPKLLLENSASNSKRIQNRASASRAFAG